MGKPLRYVTAAAGLIFSLGAFSPAARAIDIQQVVSPSGVHAWLVEDHSIPLIALSYAFLGGSAQDPTDKEGVANLVSGLLDEGAGDLDRLAFATRLEELSISLSFDTDEDTFSGSLRTLTENRGEAARLLRLALTEPRFDAEPVERIRAQVLAGLRARERSPNQIASQKFNDALFPGHVYGKPTSGTVESVAAVTVDDMRAFMGKVFARDDLKVTVVGDIDAATLGAMLDDIFGALPETADLAPVPDAPPPLAARIDVASNTPQTSIRFAGLGVMRADPDFVPAFMASYILGGGKVGTRLYDAVRVQRGLTYAISLGLDTMRHAGWFTGSTQTRADQADAVLALIQDEVTRFADEGPTEQELADAKAYMIGSYPLRFVTSRGIASQLMAIQLDNLGVEYVDKRNDMIAAVTVDDVKRAAKRLFGDGLPIVVKVGPPAS